MEFHHIQFGSLKNVGGAAGGGGAEHNFKEMSASATERLSEVRISRHLPLN